MSITAICSGESPESPLGFEACGFCESQLGAMVLGQLEFIETVIDYCRFPIPFTQLCSWPS